MKINDILLAAFLTFIPSKNSAQTLYDNIDPSSLEKLSVFACEAFVQGVPYSRVRQAIVKGILIATENQSFASQNSHSYNSTSSFIFEVMRNIEQVEADATSFSLIDYAVTNYCPKYNNYRTDLN